MTCFTCNALVPEGAQTCPRCGAKLVADGNAQNGTQWGNMPGQANGSQWGNMPGQANVSPWSNMVNQPRNLANEQKQFIVESSGSIKKVFMIRAGHTISYAVALVLALLSYFSPMFMMRNRFLAETLPQILTGVNITLTVLLLIVLSDLRGYEERFGKTLAYGAVSIAFSASQFFTINNQTVALLIAITNALCGFMFMFHYCGSFKDLAESVDEGIAAKWELMLRLYLGTMLLHIASVMYLYFAIKNTTSVYKLLTLADRTVLFALILAALDFLLLIVEVVIISKTYKSFEEEKRF